MNFQSFITEDLRDQGYKLSKPKMVSYEMKKIGKLMEEVRKFYEETKDPNIKKALEFLNKAYDAEFKK